METKFGVSGDGSLAALNRTVQWDGVEQPKPKTNITDIESTCKAARQKKALLEKQFAELPIDAHWKASLNHALSKMGMFYQEAYDDLKVLVERHTDCTNTFKNEAPQVE